MDYAGYPKFLRKFVHAKVPLKIVADASDGSVGPTLKKLKFPGIKLFILNGQPDGKFPAHGPDPSAKFASEELSREVKKRKADFGVVFDGDADRIIFVDDKGRRISSDAMALLISAGFRPPYVATVTSGWTFRRPFKIKDIKISRIGSYFIKKEMYKYRAKFGVETSGHYYFEFDFKNHKAPYDSALRALAEAVSRVSELKKRGTTLSNWLDSLPRYYNSGNLNFKTKKMNTILKKIKSAYAKRGKISVLDGIMVEAGDFWFNLRPSNTEPLLRLNLESKDKKVFSRELRRIKLLIRG